MSEHVLDIYQWIQSDLSHTYFLLLLSWTYSVLMFMIRSLHFLFDRTLKKFVMIKTSEWQTDFGGLESPQWAILFIVSYGNSVTCPVLCSSRTVVGLVWLPQVNRQKSSDGCEWHLISMFWWKLMKRCNIQNMWRNKS